MGKRQRLGACPPEVLTRPSGGAAPVHSQQQTHRATRAVGGRPSADAPRGGALPGGPRSLAPFTHAPQATSGLLSFLGPFHPRHQHDHGMFINRDCILRMSIGHAIGQEQHVTDLRLQRLATVLGQLI